MIDAEEAAKMLALAKRFDEFFREKLEHVGANLVAEPAATHRPLRRPAGAVLEHACRGAEAMTNLTDDPLWS